MFLTPPRPSIARATRIIRVGSLVILAGLSFAVETAGSAAVGACDDALLRSFREAQREVDSLRPDKAGQARVFAADGAVFTAGQASWMKGQLHAVDESCRMNAADKAAMQLAEVWQLIKSHSPR